MAERPLGAARDPIVSTLMFRHALRDLFLHGIEVEAGALLHGRVLDCRHRELRHFLLDEYEPPEFEFEPSKVRETPDVLVCAPSRPSRVLEGIQAQVRE